MVLTDFTRAYQDYFTDSVAVHDPVTEKYGKMHRINLPTKLYDNQKNNTPS